MRLSRAAACAALMAIAACAGGDATGPAALCPGMIARVQGADYHWAGSAAPGEAGPVFDVVKRERKCVDVIGTVTDSVNPVFEHEGPVVDGDAMLLAAGTRLHVRLGTEPGQELVAERSPGEWVRLARKQTP